MLQLPCGDLCVVRMMRIIKTTVALSIFLLTQAAVAAVIQLPGKKADVLVFGEITSKDIAEVKRFISLSPAGKLIVHVDTRGGDWDAAMELGRLLRSSQSGVFVAKDAVCFSSCVILLAGATTRVILEGAKVGIHRPFSTSTKPLGIEESQLRYKKLEIKSRQYLQDMNMPGALWDAMAATPPEKIKILSTSELEAFRLSGVDPALQEVQDADSARKYGVSKETYFARKNQVWSKCGTLYPSDSEIDANRTNAASKLVSYWKCEESVLKGER